MKMLKLGWGLVLLVALIAVIQLADPPQDTPAAKYQRLTEVSLCSVAETERTAGRPDSALLVLDYVIETDHSEKALAAGMRQRIFAQMTTDTAPLGRLKVTGWAKATAGGNTFETLAGSTVADSVLYGEIAELAREGVFDAGQDEFVAALNKIGGIAVVFPPAEGAIMLAKVAKQTGAINEPLGRQLRQMLNLIQPDPKSSLSVEKFRENFMPLFELSKRCRTWGEFHIILRQAESPDQVKVLTKMVSATPASAKRLSEILTVAAGEGQPTAALCLDHIMRLGPKGMDSLYAAINKGAPGLKFVAANPSMTPANLSRTAKESGSALGAVREKYQALRWQFGPAVSAVKYLVIAILCGLLVLVVVPGRYLEKLIASGPLNTRTGAEPGQIHFVLSALAVGAVLSGLAYLLSLAARPAVEPAAVAAAIGDIGSPSGNTRGDSALLSGVVVLVSLAIHAVVWFFARSKIRSVEDDETAEASLRLRRLENLDVFLDLPLFTGLALTVVAFILITLDAGMSRHFAYTSTVVGILSSVSLRTRYLYPLKEQLLHRTQLAARIS